MIFLSLAYAYDCDLYPSDTCTAGGSVVATTSGSQVTASVAMGATYRRLDLDALVCNPSGYVLHVADSPTCSASGGDLGTSDHDAEAFLRGYDFSFYGSGNGLAVTNMTRSTVTNALEAAWLDASGCAQVRLTLIDGDNRRDHTITSFDPDPDDSSGDVPVHVVQSQHGLRLDYTVCGADEDGGRGWACEWADSALADEEIWYLALNRTVGSSVRSGRGVRRACVTLSEDRTVSPASCL